MPVLMRVARRCPVLRSATFNLRVSKMLFLGVLVNRLFRAAADLRGECERRVGGRGVLRRLQELPGPALLPGRVRHLLQIVPEGVPDGGQPHRQLHVRIWIYTSSRWKYLFF